MLLMNGTITPGSHLQKQKKSSKSNQMKQQDLEQMYRELESEMQTILSDMNVTSLGELPGQPCSAWFPSSRVAEANDDLLPLSDDMMIPHPLLQPPMAVRDPPEVAMAKVYDAEVDEMMLNEEEQQKKKELWEAANGEWLRQQEEKRKQREASGKQVTKRKKKPAVGVERECEG